MAESQDVLIQRVDSEDSGINVRQSNRSSDVRAFKIAGITMLACLLVAGQALTVYYVVTQKGQISMLEQSADNLRKQVARGPPGPSSTRMVQMPLYNMPMLMKLTDDEDDKKTPLTKLENTAVVNMENQVKELLKDDELPQFNDTFQTNMQYLKEQMSESEWKGFETWMRQWLLFQTAQQKPKPVVTQTKCQLEASGITGVKPGYYQPQCDKDGNYLPIQCWWGTGYCFCVDQNGVEIPNTKVRGKPTCGGQHVLMKRALPVYPKFIKGV